MAPGLADAWQGKVCGSMRAAQRPELMSAKKKQMSPLHGISHGARADIVVGHPGGLGARFGSRRQPIGSRFRMSSTATRL